MGRRRGSTGRSSAHAAARSLPLHEYMSSVADFSFRQNYGIVFDQLAAPTAAYIRGDELESWLTSLGSRPPSCHSSTWELMARPGRGGAELAVVELDQPVEEEPADIADGGAPSNAARRMRAALGLAIIALVAALVGAYGPAKRIRTTYSWPPSTLTASTSAKTWYGPLPLAAQRPEAVVAEIPVSTTGQNASSCQRLDPRTRHSPQPLRDRRSSSAGTTVDY